MPLSAPVPPTNAQGAQVVADVESLTARALLEDIRRLLAIQNQYLAEIVGDTIRSPE